MHLARTARVAALLLLPLLAACDSYSQDEYVQEYIVESYLVADEPLPEVRLSTSAPIGARYTFEDFAVSDATVLVHLLDENGAVASSHAYRMAEPGVYQPTDTTARVLPLRTYALEAAVPGAAAAVRAQTLVPATFHLIEAASDTLVYQSTDRFETRVTPSSYPGRQSIYVFSVQALDTAAYGLTPFYADFVDDEDSGIDREDLVRNSSGIVNEENFDANEDGSLNLRLPWVAVAYFGPNRIVANAIDDNVYDFLRSRGGGTTSPGELYNVLDHVENGRGIFGSMSRDELTVFVQPPALATSF